MKNFNSSVAIYKEQLKQGDIKNAYEGLMKYVTSMKTRFSNNFPEQFSFGNVSPGYLDFTYFPFFNSFLRERKLRFGIVLNHSEIRFELWLMGQNAEVQKKYWHLLKNSQWNKDRVAMPQYSVLESILVTNPDFENLDALTVAIEKAATDTCRDILNHINVLKEG
ncbi:hypothetical protein C9426_09815 [Serratia sp. S1B]|nr:hypothetical protein C9426_09815 [Serratia sp. S1B]